MGAREVGQEEREGASEEGGREGETESGHRGVIDARAKTLGHEYSGRLEVAPLRGVYGQGIYWIAQIKPRSHGPVRCNQEPQILTRANT